MEVAVPEGDSSTGPKKSRLSRDEPPLASERGMVKEERKVTERDKEKIGKQKLTYAQIWISDENYVTGLVQVSVSEKHEEYVNIQHKTLRRLLQLLIKHLVETRGMCPYI